MFIFFAYFKNFFDRVTADLEFVFRGVLGLKKPNYRAFYREGAFVRFYTDIDNSEEIIEEAHELRNANPLSHASSGLLDRENTAEDLKGSIEKLSLLIHKVIEKEDKRRKDGQA